jgi:hypothetical protein
MPVGLPLSVLFVLRPALAELARVTPRASVLSLGYPDLLADSDTLAAIFGEPIRAKLTMRGDSAQTLAFHGVSGSHQIVETTSFFAAIGLQLDCIDMRAARGVERIVDLNHPMPPDLVGRYRMVLDPGTLEHCFNIGQAAMNAAQAVMPGGYIVHTNPLSMFNHGFYNLNPTFYHDFYSDNGFEILFMNGMAVHNARDTFFDVAPVLRFKSNAEDAVMVVIARRVEEQPIVWPVQSKYRSAVRPPT